MFGGVQYRMPVAGRGAGAREEGERAPRIPKLPKDVRFIPPAEIGSEGRVVGSAPSRRKLGSRDIQSMPMFARPADAAAPMDIEAIQM